MIFVVVLFTATLAHAGLVRLEIKERSAVLDGKPFGAAGAYERIVGKAYFEIDPKLDANQIIVDVANAPRNQNGMVEFSADFYIVRPADPQKGNGAVFYEVSNRGNKSILTDFNRAARPSLDPRTAEDFGDGFLLEQGYTILWLGWQYDVVPGENTLRVYAPVLEGIQGLVRAEVAVNHKVFTAPLATPGHKPYPVANPDDPNLKLTVRDQVEGGRQDVPRADWHIENGTNIVLTTGFEPGRFYEFVYTAENPGLAGVGLAGIRDMISWLKHGGDVEGFPAENRNIQRAYAFGASQSGRFLRTFLYNGFNRDEKNRIVLDGVMAHIAGGGRGSFNQRFALAWMPANPVSGTLNPVDIFPFTDLDETDPESGLKDGILTHATPKEFWPKIFYTNSATEYYSRAASLIHTTIDGKKDAVIPATTRIYFFAGGQHAPARFPPVQGDTRNLPNFNPYPWALRALLVDMDAWVKDGKEPPPSRYPHIAEKKLVTLPAYQFPKIPGIEVPTILHLAYPSDFGPDFRTKGIITQNPPVIGKPYPMMIPQADQDGNDASGVRMPEIQVPLATYTGWNLRSKEIGAPQLLYDIAGSFIPFPLTRQARTQSGDPRLSIEERYASREDYLAKFEKAADALATDRFLLPSDVPALVKQGTAEWDYAHK